MNKETDVYTEDDNTQSWLSLMMMIKHFEIEWEKKREIASECDECQCNCSVGTIFVARSKLCCSIVWCS